MHTRLVERRVVQQPAQVSLNSSRVVLIAVACDNARLVPGVPHKTLNLWASFTDGHGQAILLANTSSHREHHVWAIRGEVCTPRLQEMHETMHVMEVTAQDTVDGIDGRLGDVVVVSLKHPHVTSCSFAFDMVVRVVILAAWVRLRC